MTPKEQFEDLSKRVIPDAVKDALKVNTDNFNDWNGELR